MEKQNVVSQTSTLTIAAEALSLLPGLFRRHNAKIVKLNSKHGMSLSEATFRVVRPAYLVSPIASPSDVAARPAAVLVDIEVLGDTPVLEGWTIRACLTRTDEGFLVSRVRRGALSPEVLKSFAERGSDCDHCKVSRRRTSTYILSSEVSELKLVGSTCLADFTGHRSPLGMVAYADMLAGFEQELEDLEEEARSPGGSRRFQAAPLDEFLGYVRASIRINGWVSRAMSEEGRGNPTSFVAWESLETVRTARDLMAMNNEEVIPANVWALMPSEADRAAAAADLTLVEESFEKSADEDSFESNVLVVIRQGFAFAKNLGLAAAICAAADRIRRQAEEQKERENPVSEWFGTVAKREIFTVTVKHVAEYESVYGVGYIYLMVDQAGRRCKWFTSTAITRDATPEKGRTFEVKATVKAHETYKDIRETVLSRVKMVKEVSKASEVK